MFIHGPHQPPVRPTLPSGFGDLVGISFAAWEPHRAAVKRRGIGAPAATESVARWWDKSNAMASVQAIKNAFVEDDDVVIPMDSGPAKRAKKRRGERRRGG